MAYYSYGLPLQLLHTYCTTHQLNNTTKQDKTEQKRTLLHHRPGRHVCVSCLISYLYGNTVQQKLPKFCPFLAQHEAASVRTINQKQNQC